MEIYSLDKNVYFVSIYKTIYILDDVFNIFTKKQRTLLIKNKN